MVVPTVGQRQPGSVDIGETRAARVGTCIVAGVATEAGEEALAVLRQRCRWWNWPATSCSRPASMTTMSPIICGVVGAAVLSAEEVIGSRRRGFKPHGRVAARNGFALHAEGGNGEAVEHVLRDEGELDRRGRWERAAS